MLAIAFSFKFSTSQYIHIEIIFGVDFVKINTKGINWIHFGFVHFLKHFFKCL